MEIVKRQLNQIEKMQTPVREWIERESQEQKFPENFQVPIEESQESEIPNIAKLKKPVDPLIECYNTLKPGNFLPDSEDEKISLVLKCLEEAMVNQLPTEPLEVVEKRFNDYYDEKNSMNIHEMVEIVRPRNQGTELQFPENSFHRKSPSQIFFEENKEILLKRAEDILRRAPTAIDDMDEDWKFLREGRDVVRPPKGFRWPVPHPRDPASPLTAASLPSEGATEATFSDALEPHSPTKSEKPGHFLRKREVEKINKKWETASSLKIKELELKFENGKIPEPQLIIDFLSAHGIHEIKIISTTEHGRRDLAEFVIVGTAPTGYQGKRVGHKIACAIDRLGIPNIRPTSSGDDQGEWTTARLGNILLHLMTSEARTKFQVESAITDPMFWKNAEEFAHYRNYGETQLPSYASRV